MTATGVLLAAGAGSRMGIPKALMRHPDGTPWVASATAALLDGGCTRVVVVTGAAHHDVERAVARSRLSVELVHAEDWSGGLSHSLRTGLAELSDETAAVIHIVDLPDVGPTVVRRLLSTVGPQALARAAYDGRPGHPVLIGRDHWGELGAGAHGDSGGAGYLRSRAVAMIDCTDLASGHDFDRPSDPR